MPLGIFLKMQANAIGDAISKFPESDRLEMFRIILDRYCFFCGLEKDPKGGSCSRCGGHTELVDGRLIAVMEK